MIKTEMESMPTELDEISRKIMQLEIEETALSKEKDEISKQRLQDIQKEKAVDKVGLYLTLCSLARFHEADDLIILGEKYHDYH